MVIVEIKCPARLDGDIDEIHECQKSESQDEFQAILTAVI
jgi:hypothetical protein